MEDQNTNPFDDTPDDPDFGEPNPFDGPFDGPSDNPFDADPDDDTRETVHVNFGNAIPLFPLPEVSLLPQQVTPLHIFEPRYRQMVEHAIDGPGLIAMAVYSPAAFAPDAGPNPPLKPFVCVGRIVQHEKLPDGRFNILLQGVCRARIAEGLPPDADFLYRRAMLEPIHDDADEGDELLANTRAWLGAQLDGGPLAELTAAEPILEYVRSDDVPTHALLELVGFALLPAGDLRYRLLAEPSATTRASLIHEELERLSRTLALARQQDISDWPKGCAWN